MEFNINTFQQFPILAILRGYTLEINQKLIELSISRGLNFIEITMNTDNAEEQIESLSKKFERDICIGAGTVTNLPSLEKALNAGAKFIVTPTTDLAVIHKCRDKKVPIFPGAFSPSEISSAWNAGATMVKLFPASQLGPSYIKAILAPLSNVKLLATGGIDEGSIQDYLKVGCQGFGIGSPLFPNELIQNKDWNKISSNIQKFKELF